MGDTNGTNEKFAEAQDVAQRTADELKEFGRELRKRAETVRLEVIKQLHNAAANIRKEANERKDEPFLRQNADKLAKGLEKTAHYLNSRDLDHLGEEASAAVRQNPMRTLAIVFVIGLIVGMILRRK